MKDKIIDLLLELNPEDDVLLIELLKMKLSAPVLTDEWHKYINERDISYAKNSKSRTLDIATGGGYKMTVLSKRMLKKGGRPLAYWKNCNETKVVKNDPDLQDLWKCVAMINKLKSKLKSVIPPKHRGWTQEELNNRYKKPKTKNHATS